MRPDAKKVFYFNADANSLGGFIETPFQKIVPSQASASLPPVGGHATTRTEAFNFEGIISCRSAYTRVTGTQVAPDGPWSTTVTSVVEGLNILEVITAERLVAQLSVTYPRDGRNLEISLAGSHFDRLRLGGCDAFPRLNPTLLCAAKTSIQFSVFQETGREQACKIVENPEADRDEFRWVRDRFGWMARGPEEDRCVLCSLVDGLDGSVPGTSFGHAVEIPDFGRIFLGELLVCPGSVQFALIRAELGCSVSGGMSACSAKANGGTVPPH
jgi:hypothetical protein